MTIQLIPVNHLDSGNRNENKNRAGHENGIKDNDDSTKTDSGPFRKLWDDFSSTTGFHGLNRMSFRLDRTSIIRSFVWFAVWLVCTVYVIYLVITELKYYYSYPTETNTLLNMEKQLPFPAITVCNLNSLDRNSFSEDIRISNAYYIFEYPHTIINWSDPIYEQERFFNGRSIGDLITESKSIGSFVSSASFDNEPISLIPAMSVITDIGLCLRINDKGTWKTSSYGSFNNLKLRLNLDNDLDYVSTSAESSGVKVAIHDPMEEPIMSNEGIVVRPRSEAFIEIQRQEKVFLPGPFKAFGPRYCNSTPDYSHNKCLTDCYIREVEAICGCTIMISSDTKGPFCSKYQDFTCAELKLRQIQSNNSCSCTYRCEFTTYSKTLSTGEYPNKIKYMFMEQELLEQNPSESEKESILSNKLVVRVFYTDLTVIKTEQVPKYPNAGAILANLGGQLGLFLGASILTLMEIAEVLVFICLHLCNQIKKQRQIDND